MSKFTVKESPIETLKIIYSHECGSGREYLSDLEAAEYLQMGIEDAFVDHCSERFARGVLRGLRFPNKVAQGRLIAVGAGSALVIAVDLRPESKSYGASHAVTLSGENETMLYIPSYFAYGFLTLERDTEVIYNTTLEPSNLDDEMGIVWDDEILLIDWQFERYDIDRKYLNINARDKKFPSFRSYNANLLWPNRPKRSKYSKSY